MWPVLPALPSPDPDVETSPDFDLKRISKTYVAHVREELVRQHEAGVGDDYHVSNNRRLYLLGEGRLVNLAAAEGHPASVMDMSFATQALTASWAVENQKNLDARVHNVPQEVEDKVATLKLASMDITLDTLTAEQKRYLASWEFGT